MPYKYIGRTTNFKGKSLWEILGNLKNFGVGRIICRSRFQRYPEACYTKIRNVEALPDPIHPSIDCQRKVIALVERTFRGKMQQKLVQLESATYKADYFLISKCKENRVCQSNQMADVRILPSKMEFPPLLKELIIRQMKVNGIFDNEEPKMKIYYNTTGHKMYRVVENKEISKIELSIGIGKSVAPRLYTNIKE